MEQIQLNLGGDGDGRPAETIGESTLKAPFGLQPHIQRIMSRVHKGTSISHYDIVDVIGVGSHGVVYRAADRNDDGALVALKVFNISEDARKLGNFGRFRETVAALQRVDHPALIGIFETLHWDNLHFMATQLYVGPLGKPMNLLEYARHFKSVVDQKTLRSIFIHLLDAVGTIHDHSIIHCNLKPSNILFRYLDDPEKDPEGMWRVELKLTDFGVAALIGDRDRREALKDVQESDDPGKFEAADTLALLQTLEYICPYQLEGLPPTPQSDIYSMGRVLCMLLTGARNPMMLPSALREGLHPGWDKICDRATRKDLSKRYAYASQMAEDIAALDL